MVKYEVGKERISVEKIVEQVVNEISQKNYSKIAEIVDDLHCCMRISK